MTKVPRFIDKTLMYWGFPHLWYACSYGPHCPSKIRKGYDPCICGMHLFKHGWTMQE